MELYDILQMTGQSVIGKGQCNSAGYLAVCFSDFWNFGGIMRDLMRDVIIIGTGGHAKVVADIVLSSKDHLVGFLTAEEGQDSFMGWPVLGKDTEYGGFPSCCFVIAVGNPGIRERISNSMGHVKWYTAIHPAASISAVYTSVGEGSVVMANAVVNPYAQIGRHCIINSNATVEHDNKIGDFAHISVGARLAGEVTIGKRTWIGAGATVSNGISIYRDCMIGAGAVVVREIEVPGTYVGVPAHKIK